MTAKSWAWLVMTLLAFGVALYATNVALVPDARSPVVSSLIERMPAVAFSHFIGGALAIAVGALQFSTRIRTRFVTVHRWLGRTYVSAILVSGSAGLFLAINSNGGAAARWGFGLLAVAWLACTFTAYRNIRHGQVAAHRQWMIRSYAITLAALTLRFYLPAAQMLQLPMGTAYQAIAWLCWVPNLAVAEWLIRSGKQRARAGQPASQLAT